MSYWRFRSAAAIKAVDCPATRVLSVAWQPGQDGLLACVTNRGGRLVSMGIMKKDCVEFGANMGRMQELAWSPAGDLLATVGDRSIIWNSNGTVSRQLQVTPMGLPLFDAPKFSKDGSFVVVSLVNSLWDTSNRQFHKFETATGVLQQSLRISLPTADWISLQLAWKDDLEVFSRGLNNSINLWRIGQEEPLQTITLTDSSFSKMAFNPKRNILAFTLGFPATLRLWKIDTPDPAVTILTHNAPVTEFVWQSDNSDILATFDILGEVRIWETTTNTNLHIYNVFTIGSFGNIHASFSPDGRFVAVSKFGEVKIVKFDKGDIVAVCEGSGGNVKWSPRGEKLAVFRYDVNTLVFNVDKINFGINLKGLSMMRVASLLEGNIVYGKYEAWKFLENKIPEKLVDNVLPYLK